MGREITAMILNHGRQDMATSPKNPLNLPFKKGKE